LGAVACSDDSADPTKPQQEKVLEVGVDEDGNGACLLVDDALPPEIDKLPVIDCAQSHTHEIFAEIEYRDPANPDQVADVFPGLVALESFAEVACFKAFEPYVGISPFDSRLAPTWLLPTLDGWNGKAKDRLVLCVLADPTQPSMTGTIRNAAV